MKSLGWKPPIAVIMAMVFFVAPATALTVEPQWVEFNDEYGTWVNRNITLTNDENATVNITIEPSSVLSDCYLSYSTITLAPYETKNITLGVQMKDAHGYITYTYGGEQFNQFVLLAPISGNVTVDMLNEHPYAGDTVGFMLTPWVSGIGYVYVPESGNIHSFNTTWGMAYAKLSNNDVGEAVAVFSGENYHARRTFTIGGEAPNISELVITIPDVDFGDTADVTLMKGSTPIPDNNIQVTEPDGNNYIKVTDGDGSISVEFDKNGTWTFYAEYGSQNVTKSITVQNNNPPSNNVQLSISCPDVTVGSKQWVTVYADSTPVPSLPVSVQVPSGGIFSYTTNAMGQLQFSFDEVGTYKFSASYQGSNTQKDVKSAKSDMAITVPENALLNQYVTITVAAGSTIKIEGGTTITDIANTGDYSFKPDKKGRYTVTAETDTEKGTAQFDVYDTPVISIYDVNHNKVNNPVKGHQYYISVVDSNGNDLNIDVKSTEPSGWSDDVMNNEWRPTATGYYTLSTDQSGYFSSASLSVLVVDSYGNGTSYYMIILVLAALIGMVVIAKKKDKIKEWRTKISHKQAEEEENEEEEIDAGE